jgi:hypothetical protein
MLLSARHTTALSTGMTLVSRRLIAVSPLVVTPMTILIHLWLVLTTQAVCTCPPAASLLPAIATAVCLDSRGILLVAAPAWANSPLIVPLGIRFDACLGMIPYRCSLTLTYVVSQAPWSDFRLPPFFWLYQRPPLSARSSTSAPPAPALERPLCVYAPYHWLSTATFESPVASFSLTNLYTPTCPFTSPP